MTQNQELVYPYWRLRVTQNVPLYLIQAFHLHDGYYEVHSPEAIQAFLRAFLQDPQDTEIRGPLELEVFHISHEDSLFKEEGREIVDRAVYHIDFRQGKHYLIGHNHFQPEIQQAWEIVGGCFARMITEFDREKHPVRHRFIEYPRAMRDDQEE